MDYIVLDMEWNQPWPGSPTARKPLPVQIRGEILQIGAVRLRQGQVLDEFQVLIRPKYYKKLNRRVSKLTGIKEARLNAEGIPMAEAMAKFRKWCGEDVTFLTWGFDDITILKENLQLYGIDDAWVSRWFNAQMIFNAQTDGSSAQKALSTAMGMFNIEPSRPAHDALGDAYHTALICARLDMEKGTREYASALRSHEDGFHGAELPGCITRKVYYDYADKCQALTAMAGPENICPTCGTHMTGNRWFAQPGHRYMDLATCPEHGQFLIRCRLSAQADGTLRVSRLTYEASSDAARAYAQRQEKSETEGSRSGSRRRRRRRLPASESSE